MITSITGPAVLQKDALTFFLLGISLLFFYKKNTDVSKWLGKKSLFFLWQQQNLLAIFAKLFIHVILKKYTGKNLASIKIETKDGKIKKKFWLVVQTNADSSLPYDSDCCEHKIMKYTWHGLYMNNIKMI